MDWGCACSGPLSFPATVRQNDVAQMGMAEMAEKFRDGGGEIYVEER